MTPALQGKEKSSCKERDKERGKCTPSSSSKDGPPCLQIGHDGYGSHTMTECSILVYLSDILQTAPWTSM